MKLNKLIGMTIFIFLLGFNIVSALSCGYPGILNDTQAPIITINSPLNGTLLNTKKVLFDMNISESVYLKYSVNDGKNMILCSKCDRYLGYRSFSDGFYTLKVIAKDLAGNIKEEQFNFRVDKKKPKIKKVYTEILESLVNFKVNYQEENLDSVRLYYRISDDNPHEIELDGCNSGRNEECSVSINFNECTEDFDLEYYFVISDGVNQVESKNNSIKVNCLSYNITNDSL